MRFDISIILLGCFLLSWLCSAAMRRYAIARSMVDVPNQRSSHTIPTPRGGGVAFVFSFLVGLLAFRLFGHYDPPLRLAMTLGGGIVALLGFRDDRVNLSAQTKLCWQMLAALTAAACLGGWPTLSLGWTDVPLGAWGYVLAVLVLTWSTNLYNFMDGIDGLAISQAIFLALGSTLVIMMAGGSEIEAVLLAAVCLGFAFLNWPPAKLFMGDAGSGFLGFVLGVIALDSTSALETTVWPWLILGGVFIVDATFTLLRRMLTGQPWREAHRSHAYQRAARMYGSHRAVTIRAQYINIFWLLPLACAAQYWPDWGWSLCVLAWIPLLSLAFRMRAGAAASESIPVAQESGPIEPAMHQS